MQNNKHIAIVRDGSTDFEILKTLVKEVVFAETGREIPDERFMDITEKADLRLKGAVKEYLRLSKKTDSYDVYAKPAKDLKNSIFLILNKAIGTFEKYSEKDSFSPNDILIINDDADHSIKQIGGYKELAHSLPIIFHLAVQEFYEEKISQGYTFRNLPIILPLIFFPSTEILVAAFRHNDDFDRYRNQDAPTLKQMLYGTNNLKTLQKGELSELALKFINSTLLEQVFAKLPEIRVFLYQIITSLR